MQEQIVRINTEVFFFINASMKHAINDIWLGYSTHLGNGFILFPIAALVLFVYERSAFWKNLSYLAVAGVVGGVLLTQAKLFFDAPRPLAVYHDQIQAGLIHINVMFEPLYSHSFPSGHAQTAFTVAHALALQCTRLNGWVKAGFYGIAGIVAISRIYVGAHFPVDVLAGAGVGIATAHLTVWILRMVETKKMMRKESLSRVNSNA
jgi:membrane-associated phospholipid phosphatase